MQSYKISVAVPLLILVFILGIVVTVGSAQPSDNLSSQYGATVKIVDVQDSTAMQQTTSLKNQFMVQRTLTPESLEIQVGDTVTWKNYHRQKMPIILVSKDNLWEPQTIYYGKIFTYTFQNTGTYTFSIEGMQMEGSVIVSEKKMESVAESGYEVATSAESMPAIVWNQTQNVTQSMMQTITGTIAQLTRPTHEFLMLRTITPTSMEVQAGENVTWHNLHRQKMSIVLVSEDNLWEPQTIYYGKIFTYTFDKPGNYTFMLEGTNITGTVIVAEASMASVPESVGGSVTPSAPAPSPVMVKNETKEQESAEEVVQTATATQTNEFLMLRTITPTSMEVKAGETITWHNLHRQKMPIVVVSKENLWQPQTVYYGKIFTYTFDRPGTYTFMLEGTKVSGTIVVI
jgi:plastocyanin